MLQALKENSIKEQNDKMRVERILKGIKTLGPGSRLVIWTNGCNRRCKGCVSSRLQKIDTLTEVNIIETIEMFSFDDVDGVTISGGEPFIQIKELRKLVELLKNKKVNDILIYTGYLYEDLLSKNDRDIVYILENIAVLIDGEYIESLNYDSSNIKGSENQRVIFLNKQYLEKYKQYINEQRKMETYYYANLKIGVGIPNTQYLEEF